MPPQLIRVLRLSILSLRQRQKHRQRDSQSEANSRGLNLAFPACPFCSRKVTCQNAKANGSSPAATNIPTTTVDVGAGGWLCQTCNVAIAEHDVNWTFRLAFTSTSAVSPSKELSASVLGHTADVFYGCSASRWIKAVDHTYAALLIKQQQSSFPCDISTAYLEEQLSTLVDLVSGLFDEFIVADLKQSSQVPARGNAQQFNALRMSIPAVYSSSEQLVARPTLLWLWQQLASAALSVSRCSIDDHDLARQRSQLCIADLFTIPDRPATDICTDVSVEYGVDVVDHDMAMDIWSNTLLPYQNVSRVLLEPWETADIGVLTGTSVSEQDIDSLFENYSQLLLDATSLSQDDDAQDLSTQLLCESLHDEYLHNLFTNSQSQHDKSMSQSSAFINDSALIDAELEICPSFSSFLAATPLGIASRSTSVTPSRSTFRDFILSIDTQSRSTSLSFPRSTPHTPVRSNSSIVDRPIVLAQDTPVSVHSPYPSKQPWIYAAETPVVSRSLSFSGGSATPLRSSGQNTPLAIPETPTASAMFVDTLSPTERSLHLAQPALADEGPNDPPNLATLLKRRSSALFERRLSRPVSGEGGGPSYAPPPRPPKLEPLQRPKRQKTLSTSAELPKRGRAKPLLLVKNSKSASSSSGKSSGHDKN